MKIGEILIQRGLITKTQLKEALDAQLIFGGNLGTCLMELGYLAERRLGAVLAEIFDVEYAAPEYFDSIPRAVTSALNARLVERHQCVPFRLQDKILDVAMTNPKDPLAKDELAFAAGFSVRPWVSPEARVFQAMERYYDIPRRLRYITLCKQIDRNVPAEEATSPQARIEALREAVRGAASVTPPAAAQVSRRTGTVSSILDPDDESDPLHPFSQRLARAVGIDEVVEHSLESASIAVNRSMVFMVRQGVAFPWQANGIADQNGRWSTSSFGITSEPIFQLLNGDDLFHGPLPRQASYRRFYESLELDVPDEIILVPAHVDDRLVAIFYGDGGPNGRIRGEAETIRRLVRKMGLALGMIQLRQRLLSV